jgi:hypothetical protein
VTNLSAGKPAQTLHGGVGGLISSHNWYGAKMDKNLIFSQKVVWQCHILVKKVYPHQNVVELCSMDPKRQPVKVKYFWIFVFLFCHPYLSF